MGNNRPVKTSDWERFLKSQGCSQKRHKGTSHEHWKCPGCFRTITHRSQDKEIPALHLQTNLKTMGLTLQFLYDWIKDN
ncbi:MULTISPECIES: type II toxin-antitoxin system HicA family toxin [unclassified Flavobacterium]|uniref:type II toxin-antitoxin system HicA family toxin n=1 Tax=unclassified Flavobacterium TaxID=196869 RepID=UPI0025C437CF|nr:MULTISPECIES: type II toxin-antitoxin system HicA family toxin [unclassified Flavobacterium]